MTAQALSRPAAAAAVEATGWRYLLGSFVAAVPITGMTRSAEVAAAAVATCAVDADDHLRIDVRADRVEFAVQDRALESVTSRDVELVAAITDTLHALGLSVAPSTSDLVSRPVQQLEIAIDALDIAAVRPFWKAVLAFDDARGDDALVDPARQLPAIWFQQMDTPRPQRNRIHLDVTVSHDEAERRVRAAIDAGGVLVSAESARSFWILADPEGNEVCVCTWQDRD